MYKVPRERIEIVYPGIQKRFFNPVTAEIRAAAKNYFCEGKPYVLHFATGDPRDNTEVALEAFARSLTGLDLDVALLLAGVQDKEVKHIKEEVEKKGIAAHTYYTGFLRDDLLVRAYQGAEVYLDPTFYEGFGFQLGEAMACGTPVLSSKVTSVPEVVGEAGLLFDPSDVKGFALGLRRMLTDSDLRAQLADRGKERSARFSWPETTTKIIALLENELKSGRYS
jgi:glycosyltransferase involved in cell wall biosynthesis